jgi:23S rRNA (adenine2503-C2)-methyltransferase
MGMGEPLDNTENVLNSLDIITSEKGMAWSPKRITVSTVGIIPGLEEFISRSESHLALSLHNPFPEERARIMPVELKYPLMDVLKLIRTSGRFKGQRRFSVEYILLNGFNDDIKHARELVRILSGQKTRVNLIAWHPVPDMPFKGTSREKMERFQKELQNKGVTTTIRRSRGLDIQAACGLLSTLEQVQKSKE